MLYSELRLTFTAAATTDINTGRQAHHQDVQQGGPHSGSL
jgi:hypothetical protein